MKRLVAMIAAVAFVAGMAGAALAQAPTAPPKEEKKAEKPTAAKKPAAHNVSGTVKTAAPDSVVVAGKAKGKDTEWTFAVDSKTKVRKGGKDVAAAELAAGDAVNVRYHEEGGKNVADSVTVRPAKKTAEAPKAEPKKDETKK